MQTQKPGGGGFFGSFFDVIKQHTAVSHRRKHLSMHASGARQRLAERLNNLDESNNELMEVASRLFNYLFDLPEFNNIVQQLEGIKTDEKQVSKETIEVGENSPREADEPEPIIKALSERTEKLEAQLLAIQKEMAQLKIKDQEKDKTLEMIQKEQEQIKKEMKLLSSIMRNAGVEKKAEIKVKYDKLKEKYPERYEYCNTFYWTLLNLFVAYRSMGTGMFQGNIDIECSVHESYFVRVARQLLDYGSQLTDTIPVVGTVFTALDMIIEEIYDSFKFRRFNNKVEAINNVIMNKCGLEDDLSITIANLAYNVTEVRKNEIYASPGSSPTKRKDALEWLDESIDKARSTVTPGQEVEVENMSFLAMEDVVLLVTYITLNCSDIVCTKGTLDEQVRAIFKQKDLEEKLLSEIKVPQKDMTAMYQSAGAGFMLGLMQDTKEAISGDSSPQKSAE